MQNVIFIFFWWLVINIFNISKICHSYQYGPTTVSVNPMTQQFNYNKIYNNQKQLQNILLKAYNDNLLSDNNPSSSNQYIKFTGIGSKSPETVLTNFDLEKVVDTSDQWINTRTGISRRHILGKNENLSDIAIKASEIALKNANLDPTELDLIILASSSPDDLFGDACLIGDKIGAKNAACFDLTAACSGFLYGIITASQFIQTGSHRNVLVVGADALSRWVNWNDRNTCILFGDGAGAIVCQSSNDKNQSGMLSWSMRSDGSKRHHLTLKLLSESKKLNQEDLSVNIGKYSPLEMNGKEVFLFATREVPIIISDALKKANLLVENVDWLLLHQANQRILNVVAEKLGIPKSKILSNLDEFGNTSAASIPLCLDAAISAGKVKSGDIIAMAGFGAGLSWGASIIRWGG